MSKIDAGQIWILESILKEHKMLMNVKICFFTFTFLLFSCRSRIQETAISEVIPSLDELSSVWIHQDTIANLPSLRNFQAVAIANRDLTSLSWLASPPFSMGYHTGVLKVNNQALVTDLYKWSVYETKRKKSWEGLEIVSSSRMAFEEPGILWNIEFQNLSDTVKLLDLELDLIGFLSKYDIDWQWWYPTPSLRGNYASLFPRDSIIHSFLANLHELKKVRDHIGLKNEGTWPTDEEILNTELYKTSIVGDVQKYVLTEDKATAGKAVYGFVQPPDSINTFNSGSRAHWHLSIPPGETIPFQFLVAYGDHQDKTLDNAKRWVKDFSIQFSSIREKWEQRWVELFTPGNDFVSGNFPVLETEDRKARRVYYMSPLTMLYLMNTNLPVLKRVVLTGGPRWGGSIMFYWDTTSWRTIGALTDPEIMKENLLGWLTIDINKYYGRDYLKGKGVGNRYVANYWAIFQMLYEYIVVTSDYGFLEEIVHEKRVLEHMESMANNWKNLSREGESGYQGDLYKLADFGDNPWDLLEAVPTYIHIVPSFNAGYVGMMSLLSDLHHKLGNQKKAIQFKADADAMAHRILQLYAGDGTWYTLFPNNKRQEVRHCLDFHFIGRYMSEYLTDEIKEEMIRFHETELETNSWMRAQSLKDPAAKDSDRPDHGPLGAYDGWPLNSMEAMYYLGYPEKAMNFYRRIYPVTLEGNWSQAHELWGEAKETKEARVRIAERGWHVRDAASGIGMANVMLREFFGFSPGFKKETFLDKPEMVRSIRGKMRHIRYLGKYYTITSDETGLHLSEESITF